MVLVNVTELYEDLDCAPGTVDGVDVVFLSLFYFPTNNVFIDNYGKRRDILTLITANDLLIFKTKKERTILYNRQLRILYELNYPLIGG